jgi:hypothetical protein
MQLWKQMAAAASSQEISKRHQDGKGKLKIAQILATINCHL